MIGRQHLERKACVKQTTENKKTLERERGGGERSVLVWFSNVLESGKKMLMICRENQARLDESPAQVFINTKKLGKRGGERGREGWLSG